MTDIDWEQLEKDMAARDAIEDTHSWVYRCFPPRPTTCALCRADRSDPDLKVCISTQLIV